MDLSKPVSGRQFAKMVGQSEGAVRKAVERHSILKGKNYDGKYIPEIASLEWGKPILEEFLNGPVEIKKPEQKKTPAKPKLEKHDPVTAEDFVQEIMNEPLPKVSKEEVESEPDEELSDSSPKHEAERKTAIYKAKMAELAYREKKGDMIPRSKISTILFGYGQEIRTSFEGLTNRVLDRILATENRHEAKRILDEEIYNILNEVSEIPKREI